MTAQAAVAAVSAGTAITPITGTSSGDTVPAGATILILNGGAGTHVVTIGVTNNFDGLATPNRTYSLATGTKQVAKIPSSYGDANGRCTIAVDGTPGEVTYYLIA